MDDDIVERLREGALSGDLPLGAAFDWAWIADEIQRLRAALEDAERVADLRLMEIERLQGLIDAIADAGLTPADVDEWISYFATRNALLAAATKEDDADG